MTIHQHATIADTVYFWFGSNDTSGSGDDGAAEAADVRLAGAAAGAIPVLSPVPTLLTHANYPPGCFEVAVAATVGNGFAAGNTYAVFCTLTVDGENPTGFVGSFALAPIIANVTELSDDATAAANLETAYDGGAYNVGGSGIIAASVTGAVGSVTGAVGSVTGAVGSVTGAVGSVTGNVGGNVTGTVASVVGNVGGNVTGTVASVIGAVGSVTGNVGGNVTGTVASVVGNVGGNVTGTVASVVGAVGSVTGNVGGNVTGTVASGVGNVGGNVGGNVTGSVGSVVGAVGSVTGAVGSVTGNVGGNVVGSVASVVGHTAQTGDNFARIGANGAGLSNINLPNQTMDIIGDVTGNLSGSVGSVTGAVGSVTGHTNQTGDNFARIGAPAGASVSADIAAVPDAAAINAEVLDVMNVDTYGEPAQGAPGATISAFAKINYLYKAFRNRITQTAATLSIYNDAGAVVDHKATVSDDTVTYDRGEIGTGP